MGQVLYRKYRSKNLSEIIGQEHITKTLDRALKTGRISHAYLFTGPRGVGKTSIARILAHEINNIPYEDDQPNIDIIEIDAASNRRIDEIRDLRDKVHITPTSSKYKVYIIDEVHMLTKEAFNALLKTLEEPPAHVIFILATTDAHKLPETIISRTQRFSFKPVDKIQVIDHLREIAKKENIKISDEALDLIAQHGEGSFRDSISLLDQLSNSDDNVILDNVLNILGIPNDKALNKIIDLIETENTKLSNLNDALNELYQQGYSAAAISKSLMNKLRSRLIDGKIRLSSDETLSLLKDLIEVEPSNDPKSYLTICLLSRIKQPQEKQHKIEPENTSEEVKEIISEPKELSSKPRQENTKDEVKPKKPKPLIEADDKLWPEVLNELKKRYNTLYGIVRMSNPIFREGNELDLVFDFAFHQKRVNDAKNKQIIADVLLDLTSKNYVIECQLNENSLNAKLDNQEHNKAKPANKHLNNINQIFGSSEIV